MMGNLEHPDLKGLSAGTAHLGIGVDVKPRDWAAQQNAANLAQGLQPDYHEDRTVISYRTDMIATDIMRTHVDDNVVGRYATRGQDINAGNISGAEAKSTLSLYGEEPTQVSDVNIPVGTEVEASTTVSGRARQYKFAERVLAWFTNTRRLG